MAMKPAFKRGRQEDQEFKAIQFELPENLYKTKKTVERGTPWKVRVCIVLAEDLNSVPSRLASEGTSTHVHTPTHTLIIIYTSYTQR